MEIKELSKTIKIYPDSIPLYEKRFKLLAICGPFDDALSDIDFLLSKNTTSSTYLLDKANLHKKFYSTKDSINKAIPYYEHYFEYETNPNQIRRQLYYLGRDFFYSKNYTEALNYYDKALAIKIEEHPWHRFNDITKDKIKVFHTIGQYNKAFELTELIYGKTDLRAIQYNNEYIGDYHKSKQNILEYLQQKSPSGNATAIQFEYNGGFSYRIEQYIIELAYTEYKLGNESKAIDLLYDFACFDFKNMYPDIGSSIYMPHWCMYIDLYNRYANSYKVRIIKAYNFFNEAKGLNHLRHDNKASCKLQEILDIEWQSYNHFEKSVRALAIEEIETAEKLSSKNFELFKAITLMVNQKNKKALKKVNSLLKKNPLDSDANKLKSTLEKKKTFILHIE
ncbi:MAG: hypothetical protein ACK5MZ_04680 [Aestuariibaculum sp.]